MNDTQKKVLVVAYAFPPVGGAGVQRPLKFVKYLHLFGWHASVLTVLNPSAPVIDKELSNEVPSDVKVHLAKTFEPTYKYKEQFVSVDSSISFVKIVKDFVRRLLLPDVQILWWPGLFAKTFSLFFSDRPDVVFVTAPPFSSFIPIVLLCRLFKIPVVIDFRDEWVFSRNTSENASRGRVARFLDFWFERLCVLLCNDFTAATKSYVVSINQRHLSSRSFKGHVITNGFDPQDFIKVKRTRSNDKKIRIVYAGTVWKATSLKKFACALEHLIDKDSKFLDLLEVRVIGRIVPSELTSLQFLMEAGVVSQVGYLPHDAVLNEMINSDFLLLTLSELSGSEKIIPGKAFEYMKTMKPIIAFIPQGECYDLLNQFPSVCMYNGDIEAFSSFLLGKDQKIDTSQYDSLVNGFSRVTLTESLAKVLTSVLVRDSNSN